MQSPSRTADDLNPLSFGDSAAEHDVLRDFPDWWGTGGAPDSPPREATSLSPRHSHNDRKYHQHYYRHNHQLPPPHHHQPSGESTTHISETDASSEVQLRRAGSVSLTTAAAATHNSSSRAAGDDLLSAVSDETDNASRSSVKRRRTTTVGHGNFGFQPLAQVREGEDKQDDVRPWMVDVQDYDVVLGDTHEPTWGTKVYREVRKPYAKKTLDNEQLKRVKTEFQRRLEKERGHALKCPPTFWVNKEHTAKIKQSQVAGTLPTRKGIIYAYAKDQAIKDDIKNASARSRTRSAKLFNCKGSLEEAVEKALSTVEEWVSDDVDKELYAKNFREDLKRLMPWHTSYIDKKGECEQRAIVEPDLKGTHLREARIHDMYANHLESALVEVINKMGNLMVESHRGTKKASLHSANRSVDGTASCTSSKDALSRSRPPLAARSDRAMFGAKRGGISARPRAGRRLAQDSDEHGNVTISSSTWSGIDSQATTEDGRATMEDDGHESVDMELSPISVRKAILTQNLGQTFRTPSAPATDRQRKGLEVMFNTLRMGTGDDVPREVDQEAPDELSVLSMPDDVSVLLEARELAIRRGIDQPAALPRAGHVADRTKALLLQLGSNGQKKEG